MTRFSHLRTDYGQFKMLRKDLLPNPIDQFKQWMNHAIEMRVNEVNAMCLSTCDGDGMPHSRIVLLKDVSDDGFTFFTNYLSNKGNQLAQNNKVALNIFWPELEQQIRINGTVEKCSAEVSDNYFESRPTLSRLGAWASPQSKVIDDDFLEQQYKLLENSGDDTLLKRPDHWGGYVVSPTIIEFWQGRASRLHDRFCYTKNDSNQWHIDRLAP